MTSILIMGLPGSGKTTLSTKLAQLLPNCVHLNADIVRAQAKDWDFSSEGRMRQASRMVSLARSYKTDYVIMDFICPLRTMRDVVQADWIVWLDTVNTSRFKDTDNLFERPSTYDFRVTELLSDSWAAVIARRIRENIRRPQFNPKQPTVQLLGRWQPWHKGHRALFEKALAKTGQVAIMIRDCQGWQNSNPLDLEDVKYRISRDLDPLYQGMYTILVVPNITNITYGRDVGYKIEREYLPNELEQISATQIRAELGL